MFSCVIIAIIKNVSAKYFFILKIILGINSGNYWNNIKIILINKKNSSQYYCGITILFYIVNVHKYVPQNNKHAYL